MRVFVLVSVLTCQAELCVFISHMHTLVQNWIHPMLVSPMGLGPSLDLASILISLGPSPSGGSLG